MSSFPVLAPPEISGSPVFTGFFTSAAKSDCAFAAKQGLGVVTRAAGQVAGQGPDPDPRAGCPAGPVDLVRCWVDRWPARAETFGSVNRVSALRAGQGPRTGSRPNAEVGPVDLVVRGVDRDADRVASNRLLEQGLGFVASDAGQVAGQGPDPDLVGVLVRPVDLVVRGVDRYSARIVASVRVCEQGLCVGASAAGQVPLGARPGSRPW